MKAPKTMSFTIFQYRLPTDCDLSDLNSFLKQNRVIAVHREFVNTSGESLLIFIVETSASASQGQNDRGQSRIDYRDVLNADEFGLFSQLRDVRKTLAEAEGIPVYSVFSNAQLAEMVQKRCKTAADIAQLPGIGKSRVDKYADSLVPLLTAPIVAKTPP
jgi:superfamily II DNA helicase RecQ